MAIRYDGSSDLYVRSGGAWVHLNLPTSNLYVTTGGIFGFQVFEVYRKVAGVWQRILHTDKYGPNAAPSASAITSIAGGGGTRQAKITWTEATGMPLPAGSYDLYIYYYNNTDPTKNQNTMLATGRLGTTFTFPNAGASGDVDCYAELSYQEPGAGGFSGPVGATSHITL